MINFLEGQSIFEIGQKQITIFGLNITYYAIVILIGAVVAYKLSQHFLEKKGYDPESLESLFYIAFPAGIVGARLWWVIAEGKWADWYKIYEGGLAIQGGVLLGAIAGVIFMLTRRKNIPLLLATDCIVPNILLAQAIGRWGNFFNQEVYGKCVDSWTWLPDFIEDRLTFVVTNNGYTSSLLCEEGQMVVPLFLIESLLNVAGWAIITFLVPFVFKLISEKTKSNIEMANGTLMGSYFIWYGIVRAVLEPLRNTDFIMGSTDGVNNMTSVYMSIAFIVIGVIIIAICNIFKDKLNPPVLDTNKVETEEVVVEEIKEDE